MNRKSKILAFFCASLSALMLLSVLVGASIGPWPVVGPTTGATSGTTTIGHFAFTNTAGTATLGGGTASVCLSSGGTAATSVPCTYAQLQLAGTGVLTTGGSTGMSFTTSTSGCGTVGATALSTSGSPVTPPLLLTLPSSNLNQFWLTGTGSVSFIYGN